jgi:hypothetical protein
VDGGTAPGGRAGVPLGAPLRAGAGALTLVAGLTWLLLNLQSPEPAVDVLVGVVLATGGLILLMPHRVQLPRRWTAGTMALTALAGTAAGLVSAAEQECCMFAYATARGFPFRWIGRGAEAVTPEAARNLARAADWRIDAISMTADLLFWAFVGLLAVVAVDATRRSRRDRVGAQPTG